MRLSYRTVAGCGAGEYEEKKSRFIGAAAPASSESEAMEFVASVRKKRADASHNVYAYLCGGSGLQKKYSDDGEPRGTAGVPVLDVIEKGGLTDVVIVVTRYFGGTLLGAAGLIRSYGKAATLAVAAAGAVTKSLARLVTFVFEYPMYNILRNELEKGGYEIAGTVYAADVELTVVAPYNEIGALCGRVGELTAGAVLIEEKGDVYIDT